MTTAHLPALPGLADGYACILRCAIEALRPDPVLHVDAWAGQYAVVPQSAARPGPFCFSHSYPARRVHQKLSSK